YAEVQYFFRRSVCEQDRPLAMVSRYSLPDHRLEQDSSGTLLVCRHLEKTKMLVIDVTAIEMVVGMVPFP
ncbi:hypothetical protein JOM56_012721, partial [Amanita muscaria]